MEAMTDPDRTAALPVGDPEQTTRIPTAGADPGSTMPIPVPAAATDDPNQTMPIQTARIPTQPSQNRPAPAARSMPSAARGRLLSRPGWRALLLTPVAFVAAAVAATAGGIAEPDVTDRLVTIAAAAVFLAAGLGALAATATWLRNVSQARLGAPHAGALRLAVLVVGGLVAVLLTLDLLSVPVEQLVLGGAVTGVIVGIAAQQSLANLFAGVVLLLARPFRIGDEIRLTSGALGTTVAGRVVDIGLTYVRLDTGESRLAVPNSQALGAVVEPPTP